MHLESKNNQKNCKSLNILLVGMFLFALALSSPWFNLSIANHSFVKSYIAVIGSGILFLLTIYYQCNTHSTFWRISYIKITSLLLVIFGALSILWSVNIDFTITKLFLWLGTTFCFMIGLSLKNQKEDLTKIAWILALTGGTIALIGIFQYLIDPFTLTQAVSPGSTFGNRNVATQPLILILPFSCYLFFSNICDGKRAWLITFLTSLIIIFIIYTLSRSAWISLIIEAALILSFIFIQRRKISNYVVWDSNKRNSCLSGLLFILIMINIPAHNSVETIPASQNEFDNIASIELSEKNISKSSRYHIWGAAFNMIKDHPFIGTGLGTFSHNVGNEGYSSFQVKGVQRSHNDLLELGVELGIIGVSLFSLLVVSITASIHKIHKKSKPEIGWFYFLLFTSLVGSFINMQFSFPYQQAMPLVLLGLFLGLLAKQYDAISDQKNVVNLNISTICKKVIFGFWLIIFLLITAIYINWIKAYDKLNDVNLEKNYYDLTFLDTPITHSGMPSLLSRTSTLYSRNNDFKNSAIIDSQILNTWPNHIISLFRLGYGAHKMGRNNEALEYSEKLKKVEPEGLFGNYIIKLLVYSTTNRIDDFLKTFNELFSKPEHLLSIDTNTYHHLLFFTLESEELSQHAPLLYQKYIQYHGFSCEVENNIAIHYFNSKQFKNAAEHVTKAINNNSQCLNPELIKLLNQKGLLATQK